MYIIIGDIHQLISHCLIPLDLCLVILIFSRHLCYLWALSELLNDWFRCLRDLSEHAYNMLGLLKNQPLFESNMYLKVLK